jgi:hypothetical protein
MKVPTAIKFFALYPMGSLEALNLSVRFLLKTFQSFKLSLLAGERFKKPSDQGTQRSIPFGCLDSSFPINFIRK